MISDEKKLTLELYKELGLEVRQRSTETHATNRLMLPPLVIGLLVLYGEVEKFLGVEFQNAEVVHWLVWFGCALISLIWICNMSRLAQLAHWHLETQRRCEYKLGLIGHRNIAHKDENSSVSKILRHSVLRFIGFGIYFSLLLNFLLKSITFDEIPGLLKSIVSHDAFIPWTAVVISVGLSACIWSFYFMQPFRSSKIWQHIAYIILFLFKKRPPSLVKWYHIAYIILFLILGVVLLTSLEHLQGQPDAKAHLLCGLEYSEKGEYDNAIASYTKAIEIKRDYSKAYALRGAAYRAKGNDESSKADWAIADALRKTQ